jgi:hypothetical protein
MKQPTLEPWMRQTIQHWHGQAMGAALAALICFVSMYGVYWHLSGRLPDGSQIHTTTGLYYKKNWERGEPTSYLDGKSIFCGISAFSRGACLFEGSGTTVTIESDRYPRLWGDVDVVVRAKSNQTVIYNEGTAKTSEYWKRKSIIDCVLYSFWAFVFTFLGLRGLNKQISKE